MVDVFLICGAANLGYDDVSRTPVPGFVPQEAGTITRRGRKRAALQARLTGQRT